MMKNKIKIAVIGFLLVFAACSKNNVTTTTPPVTPPAPPPPTTSDSTKTTPVDSSYFITEDFEHGAKAAYAAADVNLRTGSWNLNNALIGNTAADSKINTWSVRIQSTGTVTTNFKVNGLQMVYVSSALYGTDAASSYQLQTSTDGATYTQVGSTINVSSTVMHQDSFAISATAPVSIRIIKSNTGKRINIDNVIFKGSGKSGITIDTTIVNDTSTYAYSVPRYSVVTAGDIAQPVSGDNSNMLLGNISNADSSSGNTDNYLIDQHYYIESYNATRGAPNWTAWHLDSKDLGSANRTNDFAAWAGTPNNWYEVMPSDYTNSGYSRGHNCPSADRTSSFDPNEATFLMTNMIPQNQTNNGGVWSSFENYVRTQVQSGSMEAYIIMGSYGNAGTIAGGHITVPSNIWKVVVLLNAGDNDISRINQNTRIIAINTPNDNTATAKWQSYIVTVKNIEDATGYNILSALNASLKSVLENKKDSGN